MRFFFSTLILLALLHSQNSLALFCLSGDSNYQLLLSEDKTSAHVLKGIQAVRFGELVCSPITNWSEPTARLRCKSLNVADAGFEAVFLSDQDSNIISVTLSEISFAGARVVAQIPCFEVMGTVSNRSLWISGENNIEEIDVAAEGEIEINIKTMPGTGYRWELQKSPGPGTVALIGEPEFVNTSELIGGVGVTRFRFRVSNKPNREFSILFQLRRPWEETPIKQFYIKFRAEPVANNLSYSFFISSNLNLS